MSVNQPMDRVNMDLEAALAHARSRYAAANPKSSALYKTACTVLPGGNTRTVLFYEPFPLAIGRAEAATVWDLDGHAYTDFIGEYTAGIYGHSNPRIHAAVKEALDSGIVLCGPNPYEAELAALVCARFPSCERVRFCNTGTEGNLMALTAARAFTGRERILVFNGGYHGGVLHFANGASPHNAPYDFLLADYNDLDGTLSLIEENANRLAAILIEPMMGTAGAIPAEQTFLQALREAATRHGIVLIFDEVMTSRLSAGGMQQRIGVTPDLTTFGKYIGGGLTFGAFGGRADILDQLDPRRPDALPHAGTFNNNVLTMAAGVVGMRDLYTADEAIALNARGDKLRADLNAAFRAAGVPGQATGVGSILGIHFVAGTIRRPADLKDADQALKALFHLEMLASGFYISKLGFLALSMPLTDDDYERFVAAVARFLADHATRIRATSN